MQNTDVCDIIMGFGCVVAMIKECVNEKRGSLHFELVFHVFLGRVLHGGHADKFFLLGSFHWPA